MFFARLSELRHTIPVRLTLGFLALFTVGSLLIFIYLNYQLSNILASQVDSMLQEQKNLLTLQYQDYRFPGVFRAIQSDIMSKGKDERAYRILDESGALLLEAGNLALPILSAQRGIQEVELLPQTSGQPKQIARVLSFLLGEKMTVFVVINMHQTDLLKQGFWRAFLKTEGLIILLGLAAGLWIAGRFHRQIEAFNELTQKIVKAGDLSSRMPVRGRDEFAILASNMNAMLERIEKLVQGIRQVGDNIAHDLRTPLTRLRAGVEVALMNKEPDACRASLERVVSEVEGMQSIFNSILALGQVEAGGMRLRSKIVDFSALLNELEELYDPSAEENEFELECQIAPDLRVQGDKQLLAQTFSNLLDNAMKYVPTGGKIGLSAARKGNYIEVMVEDNGPGIPPGMREKIFERFTRIDPSRTLPGTGLGLALVKAFVDLHKGSISVLESALGGAAFKITLPASDEKIE